MNDVATPVAVLTAASYKSGYKPIWCPGCGDYSVLSSVTKALARVAVPPEDVVVVSGIGCSSRIPAYTTCYGCHAPLAMEPDNRLDFRAHFIHTRSNRMPADPYKCETCHLTKPTGPDSQAPSAYWASS